MSTVLYVHNIKVFFIYLYKIYWVVLKGFYKFLWRLQTSAYSVSCEKASSSRRSYECEIGKQNINQYWNICLNTLSNSH